MVSVRPDWSDGSDLFGHTDLNGNFIDGPICAAFDSAIEEPARPVLLCLDEMNLARVEYYLSDFLSVIESRDRDDSGKVVTDQIAKMEANAAAQPDGISVAVIDTSATTAVINELIAAGIHVSTFDVDAPDSDREFYCGHSTNYQDGWDIAEMMAEKLGGEGQVGILSGSLSAQNHIDRVQGFKDCLAQEYPNIEVVDEQPDNDSVEDALAITEGYISTYPDLKAVFGCNGAAPNGAARAVIDAGKSGDIIVVGMAEDAEAAGYVRDGVMYVTLKQKVPSYGYNSVYNMIMIADGVGPVTVNGDIPADFITIDNVDDFEWE